MLGSVKLKECRPLENLFLSLFLYCCLYVLVTCQDISYVNGGGEVLLSLDNQSSWSLHSLSSLSTAAVLVPAAPSDVNFYIFQAHSFLHNISLSYNETLVPHNYVNGTNLGLVWKAKQGQGVFHVFNPNPENVTVMFAIVAYGAHSPVPGGCNMEFEVETAPYLRVWFTDAVVEVNAQPAKISGFPCTRDSISHDMYRMYIYSDFSEESYFAAIQSMLTPDDIIVNGSLAPVPVYGSAMRRLYSLYSGTGSVYVVLAHTLTGVSAYVPSVSYGCSAVYISDSCSVLTTTFSKVLCASVLFMGFFACFYGHSFFKVQVFLAGFLSGSLLAYIGLAQLTTLPHGSGVTLSCVVGLAVGVVCSLMWYLCGIPMLAILLLVFPFGILVASNIFFIGLSDLPFAQLDAEFWLIFVLLVLVVMLVLSPLLEQASIVSCAVVGAYAATVPFDHYLGGHLKYIVVNTLRRATVPGFSLAIVQPPLHPTDGILAAFWFLFSVIGVRVQQIRQQGRPPFPPGRRQHAAPAAPAAPGAPTARTALRVSSRIPYGSVGDDDVFETPPPQHRPGSLADWLGRGCGLRAR